MKALVKFCGYAKVKFKEDKRLVIILFTKSIGKGDQMKKTIIIVVLFALSGVTAFAGVVGHTSGVLNKFPNYGYDSVTQEPLAAVSAKTTFLGGSNVNGISEIEAKVTENNTTLTNRKTKVGTVTTSILNLGKRNRTFNIYHYHSVVNNGLRQHFNELTKW